MPFKILLTGKPGCGKTTLVNKVLDAFPGDAGGFTTRELRVSGVRVGFEVLTLDGRKGILAHRDIVSNKRVGKYGVDLRFLEQVAVPEIKETAERGHLVVIDEIGPMELYSRSFQDAVLKVLNQETPILATIVARSHPFSDAIKQRKDVDLIEVRPDNRETLVNQILEMMTS